MDSDLMDFFDFSKEFKRGPPLSKGCITGDPKILALDSQDSKPIKREKIGTDYVNEIVEQEKKLMNKLHDGQSSSKRNKTLDDLDSDEDDIEMEDQPQVRSDEDFYQKYRFDLNRNRNLPIYAQREEIVTAIRDNPVVILQGDTGCGKTTQVPQYILDEAFKKREFCNICVTQPRRIAAISITKRVCQERQWDQGTVCNYQVGLHKSTHMDDTRILYCTTGVLLNNLIRQKTLTHYTHIILDEVHERDQDMDFLLIVVRRLLALNSRHVKVILMSATIDTREFSKYFATSTSVPPVVTASHGRKFPLKKFYGDQLKNIDWSDEPQQSEPGISSAGYDKAIKILLIIDNMEIQQDEISYEEAKSVGAVLIFLPGVHEIDTMAERITNVISENLSIKITIVRCHSLMSPDAQAEVFQPPPPGYRKVILTTNISESSITVPDVSYVIDFCLTKSLYTDSATNFSSLRLEWASKVNCRQRAGRVGRLRSGRVYRMVTKAFYIHVMQEFGMPEMLRSPLQNSILRAKELEMGPPSKILALAMSPPNLSDIHNTVLSLKEVGALFTTVDGAYEELDGDLTYWGTIMTRLPIDVHLSRLIILGYIFNCLREAIIIAAGLTVRGVFITEKLGNLNEAFWQQYLFADGSGSDLISIYRVYMTYQNMCQNQMGKASAATWAKRFRVNLRSIKEMHLLVQELESRCQAINLQPMLSQAWSDEEKSIILKVIIAGAFYPNYFMGTNKVNEDSDRNLYQVLNGRDPCRTVFFTKFEPRCMGELYTRRIKELFLSVNIPAEKIDVTFQPGSEKVFVTFKEDEDEQDESKSTLQVPGRVVKEVYKALRMRVLNHTHRLRVMDTNEALKYVQQRKIGVVQQCQWEPPSKEWNVELLTLPSVFDNTLTGNISHIVNCGKFYFQPCMMAERITNMSELFNAPQHLSGHVRNASAITKGVMLLGKRGHLFQRAVVISVEPHQYGSTKFRVRFIDYGDRALLSMDQLRLMPHALRNEFEHLPPRMFECRLALVQPSSVSSKLNRWPEEANQMLRSVSKYGSIEMEIYSLVDNVTAVLIHMRDGLLNDKLVERKLARRADEDYMSRKDHDFRIRKQLSKRHESFTEQRHINEHYLRSIQLPIDADLEPPPLNKCNINIGLKGPFSPLETTMSSMVRVGLYKSVTIDQSSVNGVLLDTEPQDRHDQMLVAASVAEHDGGQNLSARSSTLMPNIHGFGALMTMLFCPTMQIKCNKEHTKYVTILAGLGYNTETMEPYFEERDIVINLDTSILKDDIRIINQMRYFFDSMFYSHDNHEAPLIGGENRAVVFNELSRLLRQLLNKDRSFIERHSSSLEHVWENMDDLEPPSEPFGKRCIFPMHCAYDLENENMSNLLALQANCSELYNWRNFDGNMQPKICRLCNRTLESVAELRLHLLTQLHRDREKQIDFKET